MADDFGTPDTPAAPADTGGGPADTGGGPAASAAPAPGPADPRIDALLSGLQQMGEHVTSLTEAVQQGMRRAPEAPWAPVPETPAAGPSSFDLLDPQQRAEWEKSIATRIREDVRAEMRDVRDAAFTANRELRAQGIQSVFNAAASEHFADYPADRRHQVADLIGAELVRTGYRMDDAHPIEPAARKAAAKLREQLMGIVDFYGTERDRKRAETQTAPPAGAGAQDIEPEDAPSITNVSAFEDWTAQRRSKKTA